MENKEAMDFNFAKTSRSSSANRTRLLICPTTGGSFELNLPAHETVIGLKNAISRKLKIPQAKINLLYKDRLLKFGTLKDNSITDCSQVTLLPTLESGFSYPREDSSVVQALESLSDSQVNDFLSGRAPLVLAMRVGDHMMFIQLQLSTSQCSGRRARPTPVVVPSPGQVSDHQEIPSPTVPHSSHTLSRNMSQFSNFPASAPQQHTTKPGASEVLSSRTSPVGPFFSSPPQPSSTSPLSPAPAPGAIIESMHHLGGGVYSGKFSGTLDPTLQDQGGRPRRDISTIIHILNDLLGATPQYRQGLMAQNPQTSRLHTHSKGSHRQDLRNSEKPDDSKLREKVQQLKRMMEERKFRRRERRDVRAPYHWHNRNFSCGQSHVCIHDNNKIQDPGHNDQEVTEDGVSVNSGYQGNGSSIEQDTLAV
ncbi:LOW QUALITY PROTEIN: midnolin-A-like [Pecten maximus]|uniref:LOW QUALITY PROTEIN: midnolin-A-like n=1 Tax=Pecten maximus TaxID=6579 RepID=UPI0014584C01|nr:LOW QUALITY PROTEIN: midnolin-A-like [Pecten maximus]